MPPAERTSKCFPHEYFSYDPYAACSIRTSGRKLQRLFNRKACSILLRNPSLYRIRNSEEERLREAKAPSTRSVVAVKSNWRCFRTWLQDFARSKQVEAAVLGSNHELELKTAASACLDHRYDTQRGAFSPFKVELWLAMSLIKWERKHGGAG